ncbi:MAG: RNA-directed DNA polymerase [Colwellia sp.]|uniref:reverse transcriptase family protein n=1 Tax=Pseudoalteromonas sp. S558 TaxID=2066515 RepID=UPI000C0E8B49|nr:reverse transcriptase family protein [Pseudoalteromonas sp. S558]MBL1384973.1 RNA-directed DNA polymerase [Colwellia sp.]TMO02737.1 RNA-directed DNA polymerase [Pseudoalteromonas sp. S558]
MFDENQKRSLREIFISTFHEKMSFQDFIQLDVGSEFQKFNLKRRTLYAPSPKLKQIHRFLNNTIFEFADYNTDVVFSYRKGVNIRDAVEKHSDNNFFFQTDLSNFYSNIHESDVSRALSNQLTNTPVSDIEKYIDKVIELVVFDDHIPAGFSTSPILSNICLFEFDNQLNKYCNEHNLTYTRYSDDLIISSKADHFSEDIESVVSNLLSEYINAGIIINKLKTKLHKKGHNFKLLGFNVLPNGVVTIPSVDKKEIETLLYFYLTDSNKFENYFQSTFCNTETELGEKSLRELAIGKLSGKLIAFNSMDKQYVSKLRRKYGNTMIDMFIRKSVK